ncbi:class I SAM-dependent methyltransferase [Pyxidicoccus trucidator]|uniref:class I SAM-dependent methyltransferase n=1 Tax=Pyxidicoccus trucidator TaxID=2709662 RepID=UPI001967DA8E|nr:class I SAM-dependent methyltransferase [Pyxidicoccus trucidator]
MTEPGVRAGEQVRDGPYVLTDGIFVPDFPVAHREEEYHAAGFELLRNMQHQHFWYLGRRRFLLHALRRHLGTLTAGPRAIDLGGGAGGWASFLAEQAEFPLAEIALADSSALALQAAAAGLPSRVSRYQVDLLRLGWQQRWELIFLLDVLEHIPDDRQALAQVHEALAPGGFVLVTTPALQRLWTWNDEVVGHQRRYSREQLSGLARECGFRVLDARYFMFLLSPMLLASRLLKAPDLAKLSEAEVWALIERSHRVPSKPLNTLLRWVFNLETPLGHLLPFPWGTSVLAVLQKA